MYLASYSKKYGVYERSGEKSIVSFERNDKTINTLSDLQYIERMKRHEEKMLKKIDRKERRKEERFQKMMMDASGEL